MRKILLIASLAVAGAVSANQTAEEIAIQNNQEWIQNCIPSDKKLTPAQTKVWEKTCGCIVVETAVRNTPYQDAVQKCFDQMIEDATE